MCLVGSREDLTAAARLITWYAFMSCLRRNPDGTLAWPTEADLWAMLPRAMTKRP